MYKKMATLMVNNIHIAPMLMLAAAIKNDMTIKYDPSALIPALATYQIEILRGCPTEPAAEALDEATNYVFTYLFNDALPCFLFNNGGGTGRVTGLAELIKQTGLDIQDVLYQFDATKNGTTSEGSWRIWIPGDYLP